MLARVYSCARVFGPRARYGWWGQQLVASSIVMLGFFATLAAWLYTPIPSMLGAMCSCAMAFWLKAWFISLVPKLVDTWTLQELNSVAMPPIMDWLLKILR